MQLRVDKEIIEKAAYVLAGHGLNVSDALRLILKKISETGELPDTLRMTKEEYEAYTVDRIKRSMESRSGSSPAREFLKRLSDNEGPYEEDTPHAEFMVKLRSKL